jgi:hypothetical protein
MPVPLPTAETVTLAPPTADEVGVAAVGCASAGAPNGRLTPLQRVLLEALFPAMTGHPVDLAQFEPVSPEEFANALARRDLAFRTPLLQIALVAALVLRPLPPRSPTGSPRSPERLASVTR